MRACWIFLGFAACGRIDFAPRNPDGGGTIDARDGDGESGVCAWGTPSLVPVNSVEGDWGPALRATGDLLVFSSTRKTQVSEELYQATPIGTSFGSETEITILSSGAFETSPAWNATGNELYFSSTRNAGNLRLYVSSYSGAAFQAPTLVPGLTTVWAEAPELSTNGLELFYDDGGGAPTASIWRATRANLLAPWVVDGIQPLNAAENVAGYPSLTDDGLTMYYEGGGTAPRLYESHRASTSDPFTGGTVISELTGTFTGLGDPDVSQDGQTMFFSAKDASGTSDYDIYVSTRTCN